MSLPTWWINTTVVSPKLGHHGSKPDIFSSPALKCCLNTSAFLAQNKQNGSGPPGNIKNHQDWQDKVPSTSVPSFPGLCHLFPPTQGGLWTTAWAYACPEKISKGYPVPPACPGGTKDIRSHPSLFSSSHCPLVPLNAKVLSCTEQVSWFTSEFWKLSSRVRFVGDFTWENASWLCFPRFGKLHCMT